MAAYVEEIEVVLFKVHLSGNLIENYSDSEAGCEDGNCTKKCFEFCLNVVCIVKENTDCKHRAVANHGLDVDADCINENVTGIEHNCRACEYRIGRKEGAEHLMYLAACKARQETDKHRRGAELPGEYVPYEAIRNSFSVGYTENKELWIKC